MGSCEMEKDMGYLPAVVNNHLDAIDHDDGGGLLLAASSLTNRYWTGSLWYYANADDAPDVEKCTTGVELETGIGDARWIPGTNRVLAGCDSGSVQLWQLVEESQKLEMLADPIEHDSVVNSVHINADKTKFSSASQDRTIRIWDLEEMSFLNEYVAHADTVWGAVWHLTNPSVFVSCSQDGKLLLWDQRNPRPAYLMDTEFLPSFPTCVAWQPGMENMVAIGTETGEVLLQDVRRGVGTPVRTKPHTRAVHRLAFSPHKSSWLASASEDSTAVVLDITRDTSHVLSRNTKHSDFVQGLSWHPKDNTLYTCGWDHKVISQNVSSPVSMETEAGSEETMEVQSPEKTVNGDGQTAVASDSL